MSPEKNSPTPPAVPSTDPHSRAVPVIADAVPSTDSHSRAVPAIADAGPAARRREIGGPAGPEPTRFGDWERKGRCVDF
ncbi:MAG: DUF1674 domain-containing protein [Steroidobacteraceae bacterium]